MNSKDLAFQYYLNFENTAALITPSFVKTHTATISDSVPEEEVFWRKSTHQILVNCFFDLLMGSDCDFFVEIGAFDGSTSLIVEALGIENIVAFEANPFTHKKFVNNFLDTRVKYLNLGLSSKEEVIKLKIPDHSHSLELPNSSMLQRSEDSNFTEVEVNCISLEQVSKYLPSKVSKGALWIDIEGMAYEVLSASTALLSSVDIIFAEVEDFKYWKNQNLAIKVFELMITKDFIPLIRDYEGRGQYNVIFVRKELANIFNSFVSEYLIEIKRLAKEPAGKNSLHGNLLSKIKSFLTAS